jgi:sensor domain CHASE-containing protein
MDNRRALLLLLLLLLLVVVVVLLMLLLLLLELQLVLEQRLKKAHAFLHHACAVVLCRKKS